MDNFIIRQAGLEDVRALAQIGAATFLESFYYEVDGKAIINHCEQQHSIATYEKYLSAPRTRAWLAEYKETGVPIGYALNCEPELDEVEIIPGDIELKRIYVFSRHHASGAGRDLMAASFAHARELGAPRLLLGANEENHRAIAFYKKNGFDIIGERKFCVGGVYYDDVIMGLNLK